jgi:type I restriction-modification system DNA methylase subunit
MSVRNTVKSIQDIMRQDSGVDGDAQRLSQLCWMFFLKIIDDQDQEIIDRRFRQVCNGAGGRQTRRELLVMS